MFLEPCLYKWLEITEILCVIIFALTIFKSGGYCIIGLIFITLLFGIFYIFSPFMVSLLYWPNSSDDEPKKQTKDEFKVHKDYDEEKEIFSN